MDFHRFLIPTISTIVGLFVAAFLVLEVFFEMG